MACIVRPPVAETSFYRGLDGIFEYTNFDGALQNWNCGQAAAATLLTHHGCMDPAQAAQNMAWLEKHHPPDQFGGWFGTGRHRVERMLHAFSLDLIVVVGEAGLMQELERHNPVILMLGLSAGKWLGMDLPGGHWMVAYGYDAERIYLANGGTMTLDEIRTGWNTYLCRWVQMSRIGLARRPLMTTDA